MFKKSKDNRRIYGHCTDCGFVGKAVPSRHWMTGERMYRLYRHQSEPTHWCNSRTAKNVSIDGIMQEDSYQKFTTESKDGGSNA